MCVRGAGISSARAGHMGKLRQKLTWLSFVQGACVRAPALWQKCHQTHKMQVSPSTSPSFFSFPEALEYWPAEHWKLEQVLCLFILKCLRCDMDDGQCMGEHNQTHTELNFSHAVKQTWSLCKSVVWGHRKLGKGGHYGLESVFHSWHVISSAGPSRVTQGRTAQKLSAWQNMVSTCLLYSSRE